MISDFREVNKRLVRKLFPIPKISTVLKELEGFTFATSLDLNTGYYSMVYKSVLLSFPGVSILISDYQLQVLPTSFRQKWYRILGGVILGLPGT